MKKEFMVRSPSAKDLKVAILWMKLMSDFTPKDTEQKASVLKVLDWLYSVVESMELPEK